MCTFHIKINLLSSRPCDCVIKNNENETQKSRLHSTMWKIKWKLNIIKRDDTTTTIIKLNYFVSIWRISIFPPKYQWELMSAIRSNSKRNSFVQFIWTYFAVNRRNRFFLSFFSLFMFRFIFIFCLLFCILCCCETFLQFFHFHFSFSATSFVLFSICHSSMTLIYVLIIETLKTAPFINQKTEHCISNNFCILRRLE